MRGPALIFADKGLNMKKIVAIIFMMLAGSAFSKGGNHTSFSTGAKSEHTHVNGYTKKDGTHVAGYDRSTADSTKNNNWSTKGNTNPETGKPGTKNPD